ncbi:MAG: M48 family metalloprotease [Acidobacteria bacterium]|nr:M48 family metalloprotease [Acidobacteriota bacterium]
MLRIIFLFLLIVTVLAVVPNTFAQTSLSTIDAQIQQARTQGLQFLNSQDDRAKKAAKKNLDDAEKALKEEIKRAPGCDKCHELLVATYFYQTYFGFSRNYDECLKLAEQATKQFPANGRIAYFQGYAYYNVSLFAEANKAFKRALPSVDPQTAAQITQILQASQQQFLTNWNRQANYYQTKESRIEVAQGFQMVTAFQVTPEWEMQLGGQGFAALTANAPKVVDAEIQTYLQNLTTRLLSKSPGSPFNYQITLVNSPEVNAVTPPGHIIVYTGLLAFADNEAQLAGVLAHELAHNYGHHSARAVIKNYHMQSIANAALRAINPQNATAQIFASLGANIGLNLFARAYSRFEEKEADQYGAHLMFNAGYSPLDASSFFLKMSKASGKQPPRFLSTHPPLMDRADYLADYLESFPADGREFRVDSEEFKKIKARLTPSQPQQRVPGRGVLPPQ